MIDLNDLFAGIGQRAAAGVNPWASLAPSAPTGGDPFASLQSSGPSQNDPWASLGRSGSNATGFDPWSALQGSSPVGKALSMISAAKNKLNPTPNTGAWTANALDPNTLTPEQRVWYDKARTVAQTHGVDPDIFARQIFQESGFNPTSQSPKGAQGIAQFMPDTAKGYHLTNPFDGDASLDAAARMDKDLLDSYGGDYQKALAAYNAGPGNVNSGAWTSFPETQTYVKNILSPVQTGNVQPSSRPSQFGAATNLNPAEQYAACGPAAAIALAGTQGRNFDLRTATNMAAQKGYWDTGTGMHGIASEVALLRDMGVNTTTIGADWNGINSQLQAGKPLILDTPGHYFYVDGMNTQGQYHVGTSGTDLKGGSDWMTPQQMSSLMGTVRGAVVLS